MSHPAVLFEIDPELKLTARHESLLCPCACSWSGDQQSAGEMVKEEQLWLVVSPICRSWVLVVPWASVLAILFVMPPLVSSACFA